MNAQSNSQSDDEVMEVSPPPRPTPEVVSLLDDEDYDTEVDGSTTRVSAANGPAAAVRMGRRMCMKIIRKQLKRPTDKLTAGLRLSGDIRSLLAGPELSWFQVVRKLGLEEDVVHDVRAFDAFLTEQFVAGRGWRAIMRNLGFRSGGFE